MDRDRSSFGDRSFGRPSQLVVKESGRKPLFGAPASDRNKENDASRARTNIPTLRSSVSVNGLSRSTSAEAERRGSFGSPRETRMLKPGFSGSARKRLSMNEAFTLAAQEKDDDTEDHIMDASPSPAPRVWRERREGDENRMRKLLGQDHLDTKAPSRPFSRQSLASSTIPDKKPSPEKSESPRRRSLYATSRIGLGPRSPAPETATTTSDGVKEDRPASSLSGLRPPSNWGLRHMPSKDDLTNQGRIPALVPGIEDPLPSIEGGGESQPAPEPSPAKSFAWDVDEDFTAGDLQVSDSPRIRMGARPFANRIHFDEGSEVDINSRTRVAPPGSRNTKLDEIRTREVKTGSDIPLELPRPHNTKLDEIRDREERVEHQIPIPDRHAARPRNTKLDDIRQREINGIPRRSFASIRLGEIREQNSMIRSLSPEENRPQTSGGIVPEKKPSPEPAKRELPRPKSAFEIAGEQIPDTPVTVYKSRRASIETHEKDGNESNDVQDVVRPSLSHRRTDSRDLLRQLARATSLSPAPEAEPRRLADSDKPVSQPLDPKPDPKPDTASAIPLPSANNGLRHRFHRPNRDPDSKPTVGFAGLSRNRSTDSVKSKKSMNSEADPTDRITAEANLFAPADNQSEKGSMRAPSPVPESDDEKDVEATPRAPKPDPLTMPTPRVTGAYVETPATAKVEKIEIKEDKEKEKPSKREERPPRPRSTSLRNKRTELVATSGSDRDTASDPGTDEKPRTRTSSTGVRRRRPRSLSRRRAPLKNSARLPSVKDDLKELQRVHHIDDSTLDDLEEVLLGRKAPSQDLEALLDNLPQNPSLDDDFDFDLELDTKLNTRTNQIDPQNDNSDLVRLTRMNNTLKSSLYGIHTAARGIERLSDQVNKNRVDEEKANEEKKIEDKPVEVKVSDDETAKLEPLKSEELKKPEKVEKPAKAVENMDLLPDKHSAPAVYTTHPSTDTVSYIQFPIPRLYRRKPFRLSWLGLLVLVLSLWYAAESAMCAMFCRPTRCGKTPCVWSINDPTFGTAIPVKLDQWTTGGRGRVMVEQLGEELQDWIADAMDALRDRDITKVDISGLSFEQKRQHRRRLRKKGLVQRRVHSPEQQAKFDAWHQARVQRERQEEAREMGYDIGGDDDETIGGDERVW
ncbi:uncharacterized protein NECHADRAFT_42590 [Fusarium vanettenii 77-13-4]|uniref:Uncharacterized protein n=1 Tax=Fusarium vanettenii (strain ATCC MYA-4622 / CBS 123669 / FGSC 9596 / NRRL 45880 / 77-13-4) TaxID=660122 RepID=C7ZHG8_FUSV7|nr:uncharacterized protein NECHADRAFT_42590 [Fusarium vanettenii 77-13-4]EEU36541.1 hypothetical protein NECHADRAFT_42590 [Fusarium vanettenii 77-13-4]